MTRDPGKSARRGASLFDRASLALAHALDPERAHALALTALRLGLTPSRAAPTSPRLRTTLAGLDLPNPIGLAAGFDKNAVAVAPLLRSGFGFIEVGAVTPRPQPGNPRPRLFRLSVDRAAINRFGFNNEGADAVARRLADRPAEGIVGLNLGANKDSEDRAADFASVLSTCGAHVDFATVNVSSPNTERLRDLQGAAALAALLSRVMEARAALPRRIPVFLKVAPDLAPEEIREIAAVAREAGVDAIVATNTTLAREGLASPHAGQAGGLSGAPLFERSTAVLAAFHRELGGAVPLVGVGGIFTAEQALAKIRAGATAVQLYTALIYEGIGLPARLAEELDSLLAREGFGSVAEAVGTRLPT